MKRLATVVAALALALGLATPSPADATSPACSTDATFCLSYAATPSTSLTQQPVDLTAYLANTSPNHDTDSSTWATSVTVAPLAISTSGPLITPSAELPDGLLIAGTATDCGTGSGCTAGYGTGYARGGSCLSIVGTCNFAFGIQRITNVQNTTHHNEFTVVFSGCITNNGLCGITTFNDLSQNVTFDGATGAPTHFSFVLDPAQLGVTSASLDTLHLALLGSSDQTVSGPADKAYDWFRLPARCGSASGSATATDAAGKSATATATFAVTGCLDVTGTASATLVRYGAHATLAGGLTRSDDTSPAVAGAALLLRTCPVGRTCTTSAKTAGATGDWSFLVAPQRTTTYSVLYAGPAGDTDWVPVGRSFTIRVMPLVTRRASATRIHHGGRVTVTGTVTPNDAGAKAALQRYVAGTWKTLATTTVTSRSTYALTSTLAGKAGSTARLRVRVAGNTRFATAVSTTLPIRLT
ncbi:MAG TPA: hypothetical protein VN088_06660 [Nocardioides sp.]|nr:hypothetical protein [Nocardioides sp.]